MQLEERIKKGIAILEKIEPSKWNEVNTVWVKKLMYLMKEYLSGAKEVKEPDIVETAKEIFELKKSETVTSTSED